MPLMLHATSVFLHHLHCVWPIHYTTRAHFLWLQGGSIVAPLAHACNVHAAKQVHQPCTLACATVSRTVSIWPPSQLPDDATTAVTIALLPSAGRLHRRPRCQRLSAASFELHAASTITVVQVLWQTATPFAPLPWCNSIAFEACHYVIPTHS